MSADRTYGDELADVFASFAVEKNPTGLSVGIDSAYELGDYIESDWLVEHDRQVAERAWDEGQKAGLLRADFEYGAIGYQHVRGNPYRAAKGEQK